MEDVFALLDMGVPTAATALLVPTNAVETVSVIRASATVTWAMLVLTVRSHSLAPTIVQAMDSVSAESASVTPDTRDMTVDMS